MVHRPSPKPGSRRSHSGIWGGACRPQLRITSPIFYFERLMRSTLLLKTTELVPWRRQRHPTPVLLPGKSHGWRSLVGCSPWGRTESDTTGRLSSLFTFMHWRRKWQPTPVFLAGESQGRGRLVGCRLCGRTESDTTEATSSSSSRQQYSVCIRCAEP